MPLNTILRKCSGVKVVTEERKDWNNQTVYVDKFIKVGDIVVPEDTYIEIIATATEGTIARVVDIEVDSYDEATKYNVVNQIVTYGATFIYEVDGRKQKGRIRTKYAKALVGTHTTEYVRNIEKHKKVEVKNPVNKYKQEMQKGDWVIGTRPGKLLGIGRITRWTNHNVWAVTGNDLDDKSKEFKFDSITETFTMPNDDHVQLLTFAALKGWTGR